MRARDAHTHTHIHTYTHTHTVQAVFTLARKMAPCVIFLDEVDSLFAARGTRSGYTTKREALNEFMMEWDG